MGKSKHNKRDDEDAEQQETKATPDDKHGRVKIPEFLDVNTTKELLDKLSRFKRSSKTTRVIHFEKIEIAGHSGVELKLAYKQLKKACLFKLPLRLELAIIEEMYESVFAVTKRAPEELEKPHKPLSSYFLFTIKTRAKMIKKHPGLSFSEIAQMINRKWHELPLEKKQRYVDEAARLKEEYKIRLEEYYNKFPSQRPQPKTRLSRAKPPRTGLALFTRENREHYLAQGISLKRINDAAYSEFNRLSAERRRVYEDRVVEMYQNYEASLATDGCVSSALRKNVGEAWGDGKIKKEQPAYAEPSRKDKKGRAKTIKQPLSNEMVNSSDGESSSSDSNVATTTKKEPMQVPVKLNHFPKATSSGGDSSDDEDTSRSSPADAKKQPTKTAAKPSKIPAKQEEQKGVDVAKASKKVASKIVPKSAPITKSGKKDSSDDEGTSSSTSSDAAKNPQKDTKIPAAPVTSKAGQKTQTAAAASKPIAAVPNPNQAAEPSSESESSSESGKQSKAPAVAKSDNKVVAASSVKSPTKPPVQRNDETSSDSGLSDSEPDAGKPSGNSKKDAASNNSKMLALVTAKSVGSAVKKRKRSGSSSSSSSSASNANMAKAPLVVSPSKFSPIVRPIASAVKTVPLKFEKDSDSSSSDEEDHNRKMNAFNKSGPYKFPAPTFSTPKVAVTHREKKKHKK